MHGMKHREASKRAVTQAEALHQSNLLCQLTSNIMRLRRRHCDCQKVWSRRTTPCRKTAQRSTTQDWSFTGGDTPSTAKHPHCKALCQALHTMQHAFGCRSTQHSNQQSPLRMQRTLRLSRRSIWLTALSFDTLTTMAVTVGPKAAEIASGVVAVSSSVSCSRAAMTAISCLQ